MANGPIRTMVELGMRRSALAVLRALAGYGECIAQVRKDWIMAVRENRQDEVIALLRDADWRRVC